LMKFIMLSQDSRKSVGFWLENWISETAPPHTDMLFWSDFGTQDIHVIETVINVRFSVSWDNCSFPNGQNIALTSI
jgi:hypothetical protein